MAGTLIGIARRPVSRAPMEELSHVAVSPDFGIEGDSKGIKFPKRQVTLLQRELWEEALLALGNPDLHWTARRANLLVEGVHLPRGAGSEIAIGNVRLEVTAETTPCARMDEMYQGLRRAGAGLARRRHRPGAGGRRHFARRSRHCPARGGSPAPSLAGLSAQA